MWHWNLSASEVHSQAWQDVKASILIWLRMEAAGCLCSIQQKRVRMLFDDCKAAALLASQLNMDSIPAPAACQLMSSLNSWVCTCHIVVSIIRPCWDADCCELACHVQALRRSRSWWHAWAHTAKNNTQSIPGCTCKEMPQRLA